MNSLTFYGASSIVTGSSFVLTGEKTSLLIDLGMFQENDETQDRNKEELPFHVPTINYVLVTHAHLDHCGRLPLLVQNGFKGTIFMTEATRDIVEISLLDAAKIAERSEDEEPLYTTEDVERVLTMIQTVEYETPISCGEFKAVFHDAGHILGSASIEVIDPSGKITVFSGDLGNTPEDIVKPTKQIKKAHFVVMESTYGGRNHTLEDVYAVLQHEINEVEETNGVLIIPAFSIQRTQELIHRIGHLIKEERINSNTPIFVDSPMALSVTEIFKKYPELYNEELAKDEDPFEFDTLIPTASVEESKAILKTNGPKVIIAGSGMMNGGRVQYHLKNYISKHNTRLLFVGYQAVGTLGRKILEGQRRIMLFDEEITVHATITKIDSMSSHADEQKLLYWLRNIQEVEKVFIIHGEEESRQALSDTIKTELGIQSVILPQEGQTFELI